MTNSSIGLIGGTNLKRNVVWLTLGLVAVGCGGEASASGDSDMVGVDEGQPVMLERTATFDAPLGAILRVRERSDGSVLAADPLGRVFLSIDMDRGTADTIGGIGGGPDEYGQPDVVWRLADDRSLLVDLGNARLTEVAADNSFGATLPLSSGTPGPPGSGSDFEIRIPEGVDDAGRIYYQGRVMAIGDGDPPTEAPLRRWDPDADVVDDITMLLLPERKISRSGGPGNQSVSMRQVPLSPEDAFAVAPSGRVAVVRAEPYHVEWIEPDGSVVSGPEVAYDPTPIGMDEKIAWTQRSGRTGGGISISMSIDNDRVQTDFSRGGSSRDPSRSDVNKYDWPDVMPPFVSNGVVTGLDGTVWVQRSLPAGAAPIYDVFDAEGRLTGQVGFEAGRQLVGFGAESAYVVRFDEFDVPTIERYALP